MAKWRHYVAGADEEALSYVAAQSAMDSTPTANVKQIVGGEGAINLNFGTFIGSPVTVAHMLDELAAVPGVKGILLTLDDFRGGPRPLWPGGRAAPTLPHAKVGGGLAMHRHHRPGISRLVAAE